MKIYFFIFVSLGSLAAQAFPEMIRYGYVNCNACHVSPSGGGALTVYGRGLSAEMLSTWGSEKEAQFLHGAVPTEAVQDWLMVGGDYRGLQYHYENNLTKDRQWIDMQGMLEVAVRLKTWTFDLAFGKFESDNRWAAKGTRYSVLDQINDYVSLRVGRLVPQFGLNIPEHISPTRGALGFGAYDERDTMELQYADENWTITSSYSQAPKEHPNTNEKAGALRIEKVFLDTLKPGLSYWRGESSLFSRQIIGLHSLFGFNKKFFWLTEWDWQEQVTKGSQALQHSAFTYQKLGYELHKGVIALIVADGQLARLEDPSSQILHYGAGLQFFPRPHFEIEGVWTREKAPQITSTEGDYAWLLVHYYL